MNLETWLGARWWKVDFHTHTPASDDYGKGQLQQEYRQITPEQWLIEYMKAGIDCVIVTDHNTGSWIDRLKESMAKLESENHPDFKPLYLFPGVEISVNGGIHMLGILERDKSTNDVTMLLGAVEYNGTQGNSDAVTRDSATRVVDRIVEAGGLAIPAHADEASGIFQELSGTTLENLIKNDRIIAMELIDPSYIKPTLFSQSWTEVLGSDTHHPSGSSGLRFPGSHYTWVKMDTPSLEGLKLALLDGPVSVKRFDTFTGNPNSHGHFMIESLTVENAHYMGQGEKFICTFNPWLNSIIGGRGTGKSTIVEFLRYMMRREKEIPVSLRDDLAKYRKQARLRHDEGLLRENTVLTLVYHRDGRKFLMERNEQSDTPAIREFIKDGTLIESLGDITQRFPVRIFSQKQIFEMAKKPQSLLEIIDDAPEVNYREWREKRDELETQFLALKAKMREIETGLKEESRIRGELDDITQRLALFESAGHADIFKSYRRGQRQLRGIEKWEQSWEEGAQRIIKCADSIRSDEIDYSLFDSIDECEAQCVGDINAVVQRIKEITDKMNVFAEETCAIKRDWLDTKNSSKWLLTIQSSLDAYQELKEELAKTSAGDPS
ncbi:MAG: hypothetical protein AB9903_20315 [Vulcanimicrobiota bacterium]